MTYIKQVVSSSSVRTQPAAEVAGLEDWLNWQEQLHFTAIELGLDRCREVAMRLDLLKPDFSVIMIAGTNGKGSSAAMLDQLLRNAGYRVGAYTSPHLLSYNERITVDGQQASDRQLCQSFAKIDQARDDISLTYFEFGTLAALDIFKQSDIEVAILEVGLGGRLDAVNIMDADVALVTTVDLDHEKWLGLDREAIGREKAGIFRGAQVAICADPEPPASVVATARAIGADLRLAGGEFGHLSRDRTWDWFTQEDRMNDLPKPCSNLDEQVQNAAGVLAVLDAIRDRFPVSRSIIRTTLSEFRMPGRFQVIPGEIPLILDVAHNRQAATALAGNLRRLTSIGKTHIVLGMLRDKNHRAVIESLTAIADHWWMVTLPVERGASAIQLKETLRDVDANRNVAIRATTVEAIRAAQRVSMPGDRIIITGSFITVGAVLQAVQAGTVR